MSVSRNNAQHISDLWPAIWSLNVPPKLRLFSWRAWLEILSVKAKLVQRRVVTIANSDRCSAQSDSVSHALFKCLAAMPLWKRSFLFPLLNSVADVPFLDIAMMVWSTNGAAGLTEFLLFSWVS